MYYLIILRWTKVAPNCQGTSCPVRGLEEGKDYEFRVVAENKEGPSEPLVTSDSVRAKWPFDPPGVPGVPECVAHTENTITLEWTKPKSDGGAPITGYVVEKKEKGTDKWVPITEKPYDTEITVKGLQEGKEYEFRVAAVNKAGTGKPAQTAKAIEARAPDGKNADQITFFNLNKFISNFVFSSCTKNLGLFVR